MLSVWGVLISFWSVLVFSSAFFGISSVAQSIEVPIMALHGFFSFSSHSKSLDQVVHQEFMFGPSHIPNPGKVNY